MLYANFIPSQVVPLFPRILREACVIKGIVGDAPVSVPILATTRNPTDYVAATLQAAARLQERARRLEAGETPPANETEAETETPPTATRSRGRTGVRPRAPARRRPPSASTRLTGALSVPRVPQVVISRAVKQLPYINHNMRYPYRLVDAELWQLEGVRNMAFSTDPLFTVAYSTPLFAVQVDTERCEEYAESITLTSAEPPAIKQPTIAAVEAIQVSTILTRNPFADATHHSGEDDNDRDDEDEDDEDEDDVPRGRRGPRRLSATNDAVMSDIMYQALVSLWQPYAVILNNDKPCATEYNRPFYTNWQNARRANFKHTTAVIDCFGMFTPPLGRAWCRPDEILNSDWNQIPLLVRRVPLAAFKDVTPAYTTTGDAAWCDESSKVWYTSGDQHSIAELDLIQPQLDEMAFVQRWQDSLVEQLRTLRDAAQTEADEAMATVIEKSHDIGRFNAVINASSDRNAGPFLAMVQSIRDHPDVHDFTMHENFFEFNTSPFWLEFMPSGRDTYNDQRWWVGAYGVRFYTTAHRIDVRALNTRAHQAYIHPHNTGHTFCLSGYAAAFSSAFAQVDYYTVVLTVLEFLRTANEHDTSSMHNLTSSIGHAPTPGKPSSWKRLFGKIA